MEDFVLRLATIEDATEICQVEASAITNNPLIRLLWPNVPLDARESPKGQEYTVLESEVKWTQESIQDTPKNCWVVITHEPTNRIAAFAQWQFNKGRSEEEWKKMWDNRRRPEGINVELCDATSGQNLLKRAKILGDQDYASMLLHTDIELS
jgi:hypothetical protein